MHHLKEAEIHKSVLTGVLEIPMILKKCKMSTFWPSRYPGQGSLACTNSRQLNLKKRHCICFKTPLLPNLESLREIHKVHFYLFT